MRGQLRKPGRMDIGAGRQGERKMTDPWRELEGKEIYIYGAQMVAGSVYAALTMLYHVKTICFFVTEQRENPAAIDGIPVITIEYAHQYVEERPVVVAAPVIHHKAIVERLRSLHFKRILCVDSAAENFLLFSYYKVLGNFALISDLKKGVIQPSITEGILIGKVHSSADTPLAAQVPFPPACMEIQAGAVRSGVPEGRIGDHTGDNISDKNPYYSELTALYWLWKNRPSVYLGLCHYRRIFDITWEDICILTTNCIDVLLPYPSVHFPNCEVHLQRYLEDAEIRLLYEALERNGDGWADACKAILKSNYFYHFNMFLAKREVADQFCQWLFKVLTDVEELSRKQKIRLHERSLGYMGECLTTLFFTCEKGRLKLAHCGVTMFL